MGKIVEQVRLRSRIELFLILGRHFTGIQHVEHLLPPLGRLDRIDRGGQRVEPKAAIGVVGPVACSAVRREQEGRRSLHGGGKRCRLSRTDGWHSATQHGEHTGTGDEDPTPMPVSRTGYSMTVVHA